MPQLTFIFPQALWLLLLLIPVVVLPLVTPRRLSRWRFWGSLGLRVLALIGLVLGLAGTQVLRPAHAVTTIFLIDGSDSVALSQRARAEEFIKQALSAMPLADQAGLVVFGQGAAVERMPSEERTVGQIVTVPGGAATDIESAVQLGMALVPAETQGRLVLLSDGGENRGDARAAARIAAARGIPLDVVPLSGLADGPDAQVSAVELPSSARVGQRLRLRVVLESTAAVDGRLLVTGPGGVVLIDQAQHVPAEGTTLEALLPEAAVGFNRYVVRFEVAQDARPENNAAEAYSFVTGQPRVLLVEGSPGATENLKAALTASQLDVSVVLPQQMPDSLGALGAYEAVALVDVPRRGLTDRTLSALNAYVQDLGRGLLMVGGTQSFGPGSWRDTPVEQALPVTMDIPSEIQVPPVSIVVVIDTSGSMGEEEGGRTKLSLAAEGAMRIADLLRDQDELTVIPFGDEAHDVIGPIPGSQRREAIAALQHLQLGGGGILIHDALQYAAQRVRQSTHAIRHVITISDGADTEQQEGALAIIEQLRAEQVTLTSIAIGDGGDVPFIRDAARVGGGRTFLAERAEQLPTLLAEEAQVTFRPYIVEEPLTPALGMSSPILRDIQATPQLFGYVVTTAKPTAQVLLATPRGEPLLAVWQHGLGRAAAWTSDWRGQWGRDWVAWDEFPTLASRLFSWLLPQADGQRLSLQTSVSGDALTFSVSAADAERTRGTGLNMQGQLLAPDGSSQDMTLREVGPGSYQATLRGAAPGAYLVQIVARDATGQPYGVVTGGTLMPLSVEYRSRGANPTLLTDLAEISQGRVEPEASAVFQPTGTASGSVQEIGLPLLWLALLLLPLDIAVRRLFLRRGTVMAWRPKAAAPAMATAPVPTVAPAAAPPASRRSKREEEMVRLREAQEQARKRARGEE